jgi:hypothetical protein
MGSYRARSLRALLAGTLVFGGVAVGSVIAGALPASAAPSASLYVAVGGTGDCTTATAPCGSIQQAIRTAFSGPYAGDDVTINVAAGTYTENDTIPVPVPAPVPVPGPVQPPDGPPNSLTIAGAGASATTVNGGGTGTVFTVDSGTVTISGLTVTNGTSPGTGGGIANYGAMLTINSSTVSGNTAEEGGGIINDGTLTINSSTVSDNTATTDNGGGGISNEIGGTATITSSTVSGNTSTGPYGGGIYNDGTLGINSSTVSGNTGRAGGGIFNDYSGFPDTLTINSSTVSDNTATTNGGGGIFNDATLGINSSTVSGNTATNADGGGIVNLTGTLTINSSTVSDNTATGAAGIDNFATLTIGATIVAVNPGGNCSNQGTTTSLGYNLTDDPSTANTCDFTATGDVLGVNPLLGSLSNNGGPTQTLLPATTSPAVGAIPSAPATILGGVQVCPRVDQRGVVSVGNCTIGAVEVALCAVGLQPHVLSATYPKGTFSGLFCVNAKGVGTYTQGTVSGTGTVTTVKGTTVVAALGKNLALAGTTNGTKSAFVELAPAPVKAGTFTLS